MYCHQPNLFVIGAGKSGTTSLCDILSQHPSIYISRPKEPNYFSIDDNFEHGRDAYLALFQDCGDATVLGEGSTTYTMRTLYPKTAERLASAHPRANLIYVVRHPLDRIVSNWRMRARTWNVDFNEALRDDRFRHYLQERSLYWNQISAYRDFFPDNQIHVLFFEELICNPIEVARSCFEFLELDARFNPEARREARNTAPRFDTLVSRSIRKTGIRAVARLLPLSMKRAIRNWSVFSRPEPQPVWDNDLLRRVIDQLRDDTDAFLRFYGQPQDRWVLDDSAETRSFGNTVARKRG